MIIILTVDLTSEYAPFANRASVRMTLNNTKIWNLNEKNNR
jgi:hypothetical protein